MIHGHRRRRRHLPSVAPGAPPAPLSGGPDLPANHTSARNRFVGLVTGVKADTVMAQVEMQCGPFRVVSLMSAEAVDELGLEPGSVAAAVIKSTNVIIESLEGTS